MKIGLVGAGLMGHGIGLCLMRAGHSLTVIAHHNRAPVDDLVRNGAFEAMDLAALARGAEVVLICVSNSKAVEAVVDGIEPGLRPGAIVLDMGTSEKSSSVALAARLEAGGIAFAEAPVAGGPEQAARAELGAMVGADEATFERLKPVLEACCARVSHMGPVGMGATAKLINNYMVMGMIGLIAECYVAARAAGIDWAKLFDVMQQGSNNSGALRKMVAPALVGNYEGYPFSIANAVKDMSYYLRLADELGLRTRLADASYAVFADALARGKGELRVSHLLDPAFDGD
jgi:3-hydroxyisobutyrate dehydrogenase-like beta-hydroxyacid dehydrogenase